MEGDHIKINKGLLPLSWLYGIGVRLRNTCFDAGILKSRSFSIPVISVGNITVGGTGKTPHVEYLIRLLHSSFHVAVLSRGYKRKSQGFIMANSHSTARDIGDEPFQIKHKFDDITVAVDKNRVHGIETLTSQSPQLDVILLDDAYQHRYVKPGINILLVDYHRLIIYDRLLPAGRLRESANGKRRADIVIVTKCPQRMNPIDYRVIAKALALLPYQQLFFTTMAYDRLQPVFNPDEAQVDVAPTATTIEAPKTLHDLKSFHVLLLTGIASPQQLEEDLSPYVRQLHPLAFADHHRFTPKDIEHINNAFGALPTPRCIVTTEKDAARFLEVDQLSSDVKANMLALPIKIVFTQKEQQELFNEKIIGYVRKNSRNSILAQSKDDHQP